MGSYSQPLLLVARSCDLDRDLIQRHSHTPSWLGDLMGLMFSIKASLCLIWKIVAGTLPDHPVRPQVGHPPHTQLQ